MDVLHPLMSCLHRLTCQHVCLFPPSVFGEFSGRDLFPRASRALIAIAAVPRRLLCVVMTRFF